MDGGAWPFLVGGVICLVNSDNERDSILLTSHRIILTVELLRRTGGYNPTRLSNNRSVMPLDVQGCTRATLNASACEPNSEESGEPCETYSCLGLGLVIISHERGIPSKRESTSRADYVPALCTHRPSLLPIGCVSEVFRPGQWRPLAAACLGKIIELIYLEEVKVVTRFP